MGLIEDEPWCEEALSRQRLQEGLPTTETQATLHCNLHLSAVESTFPVSVLWKDPLFHPWWRN